LLRCGHLLPFRHTKTLVDMLFVFVVSVLGGIAELLLHHIYCVISMIRRS
jgi:hypothetical protein